MSTVQRQIRGYLAMGVLFGGGCIAVAVSMVGCAAVAILLTPWLLIVAVPVAIVLTSVVMGLLNHFADWLDR